jgi:hypothetical protein
MKVYTPLGQLEIMKDNNFMALSQYIKQSTEKANHIRSQKAHELNMFATHEDITPTSSYEVTYKTRELNSLQRMRHQRGNEILLQGFPNLVENELIRLLNTTKVDNISFHDKLSLDIVLDSCKKMLVNSHKDFGTGLLFNWVISNYRSVAIIFDGNDVTLYHNPDYNRAAIVFPERKIHLIYHNSTTNVLHDEMSDRIMYSPDYGYGGLMYDPSKHKYQTIISNINY